MRPIYITMTAIAGLSLAASASAQWHNEATSKQLPAQAAARWGHDRTYSDQLEAQIDVGVSQGTISRRESIGLREDLSRLVQLERRFSPNGISGREHAALFERSAGLSKEIRAAIGERLGWLGVHIDAGANDAARERISSSGSTVNVFVIPTNEELTIARHCAAVLRAK